MSKPTLLQRIGALSKGIQQLWANTGRNPNAYGGIGYPYGAGNYTTLFNGEKNLGEMGPLINYGLDYAGLRMRGWQLFLESEIAQIVVQAYCIWIAGAGLKLQAAPNKRLLERMGVELDSEEFNEDIEALFETWSQSTDSDYAGMESLQERATEALKNAIVSGDVLVLLRVDRRYNLTVQLVDGAHLSSPNYGSDVFEEKTASGNTIKNGIEQDSTGRHVAYWVRQKDFSVKRYPATNSAGFKIAYLVSGLKYRLDNNRAIPLLSVISEIANTLEGYKGATLTQAKDQNKNVYQITQDQNSDGTNPMLQNIATAIGEEGANFDLPSTEEGRQLANRVAVATQRTALFMPRGQKLENINAGTGQLYFKDFYMPNVDLLCAALRIPPNVALSKYTDSFSASRAATKDWEHTMRVRRKKFANEFYKPIYQLFVHLQVLKNNVQAPGYLLAWYNNNNLAIDAYTTAHFTGPMFPHIDPLKEVKAEREKLGPLGANLPLTTIERAIENVSEGYSDSVIEQFHEELEMAREMGLDVDRTESGTRTAPLPPANTEEPDNTDPTED